MKFKQLVDLAVRNFWKRETYVEDGQIRVNVDTVAAHDTVLQVANTLEIAAELCKELGRRKDISLNFTMLDGASEAETVLEYLQFLLEVSVTEVMSRDKALRAEDRRRVNKFL